jgi:DNA primase
VRSDGKWGWKCHACGEHGDSADFLSKAKGISLGAALKEVRRFAGVESQNVALPTDDSARQYAVRRVIDALQRHANHGKQEVIAYLVSRGISEEVCQEAFARGMIRSLPSNATEAKQFLFDTVGEDDLRLAGFIREKSTWPAIAFRPLIGILPDKNGAEFRLARPIEKGEVKAIRYGQLKWPWWWPHTVGQRIKSVLLVEGLIDLLSVVQIGLKEGEAVMAMPGVNTWHTYWVEMLTLRHPGVQVRIGLDRDEAGERASSAILNELRSRQIDCRREPPEAKDWNSMLAPV